MGNANTTRKTVAIFMAGVLFGVLSSVAAAPRLHRTDTVAVATGANGTTLGTDPNNPATSSGKGGTGTRAGTGSSRAGGLAPPPGLECALGRNGGETDVGVTANSIKLATTTVQTGPGAAFLGEVKYAMEAVRQKINRAGGICGRRLEIKYVDDGWNPERGAQYLRDFIKAGYFAIPVGPSSEGLRVVIDNHDVRKAGIPVVGTDGMLIDQYTDPWVWPVATSTASSARIMARDAYNRGARSFSIVFDKTYRFGVEAARAFNDEVNKLTRANVAGYNSANNCQKAFCGVLAAQPSYNTEVQEFAPNKGDFLAMFLEPTTALTWMSTPGAPTASGPESPPYGIGAGQPLFTYDFANNCQKPCDQMMVWTSYKPPIEAYAQLPAIQTFVDDLKKANSRADEKNAFSLGGYIGMLLFVEAAQKVGPFLTRARLQQTLDQMNFASGLTHQQALAWRPGNHSANVTMQAFAIQYKGTLNGWRPGQTVRDPGSNG
jgi:ABC-type branched-subunit amino acid transport system substrate-binding protein